MRKYIYICDKCKETMTLVSNNYPPLWQILSVVARGYCNTKDYLLCDKCVKELGFSISNTGMDSKTDGISLYNDSNAKKALEALSILAEIIESKKE